MSVGPFVVVTHWRTDARPERPVINVYGPFATKSDVEKEVRRFRRDSVGRGDAAIGEFHAYSRKLHDLPESTS